MIFGAHKNERYYTLRLQSFKDCDTHIPEQYVEEFEQAIYADQIDRVRQLLQIFPDLIYVEFLSGSPLKAASQNNHTTIVSLFLEFPIDVNTTSWGTTALYWAAHEGHEEIVRLLLNDPRIDPNKGTTPLSAIAKCGSLQLQKECYRNIVQLLLNHPKTDPTIPSMLGQYLVTPLERAKTDEIQSMIQTHVIRHFQRASLEGLCANSNFKNKSSVFRRAKPTLSSKRQNYRIKIDCNL